MTQAYPQFTPVQILEAGQRALSEGRTDYASQFFHHLIEHYGQSPEAADARAALDSMYPPAQPSSTYGGEAYSNGSDAPGVGSHGYAAEGRANGGATRDTRRPAASGIDFGNNTGRVRSAGPGGLGAPPAGFDGRASRRDEPEFRSEPGFGPGMARRDQAVDFPRHIARHDERQIRRSDIGRSVDRLPARLITPAPEKHYYLGRFLSLMLMIAGVLGLISGLVMIYALFADPGAFQNLGIRQPATALQMSIATFAGSLIVLLLAQMARAIFNGADSIADLVRLERFRAGDTGEYEDDDDA